MSAAGKKKARKGDGLRRFAEDVDAGKVCAFVVVAIGKSGVHTKEVVVEDGKPGRISMLLGRMALAHADLVARAREREAATKVVSRWRVVVDPPEEPKP